MLYEEKTLSKGLYIPDLYPDGLEANTIINKTMPGIRATTCEIDAHRHSIIVVPNRPVIDGKLLDYPDMKGVVQGVTPHDIEKYMKNRDIEYKKIMTTPESYQKVIDAAKSAKIDLHSDYFLAIDECEKAIQEVNFRPDIIAPYFDLFEYDKACLLSATPLYVNLKGFENHSFKYIKIKPDYDYHKDVDLIGTNNVIQELMEQVRGKTNKQAIFLNSPTYAMKFIEMAGLKDRAKIYTSVDSVGEVRKAGFYTSDTFISNEELLPISIFTSRYYSAVDLKVKDKPDVIIVTDCLSKPQTIIDPFTHSVQISGRFRNGVGSMTHITNYDKRIVTQTPEYIMQSIQEKQAAYKYIKELEILQSGGGKELLNEIIERIGFEYFMFQHGKYKGQLNPFLVQFCIDRERVKGYYKNPQNLIQAYEEADGHFTVQHNYHKHDKTGIIVGTKPRLSKKEKQRMLERLEILMPKKEGSVILRFRTDEEEAEVTDMRVKAPEFVIFYQSYGAAKIRELDYDLTKMKEILRRGENETVYFEVIDEVHKVFLLGKPYTENEIRELLQPIYDKYQLTVENSKHQILPLQAAATDLQYFFEVSDRITVPKTREKGYIPLQLRFNREN